MTSRFNNFYLQLLGAGGNSNFFVDIQLIDVGYRRCVLCTACEVEPGHVT